MRRSTEHLTLRKGKVEEKPFPHHYSVRDFLNDSLITVSLSGKLRMANFDIEIGEVVYVIVSIYDKSKGKLAIEGRRGGLDEFRREKEILDENRDPLEEKNKY